MTKIQKLRNGRWRVVRGYKTLFFRNFKIESFLTNWSRNSNSFKPMYLFNGQSDVDTFHSKKAAIRAYKEYLKGNEGSVEESFTIIHD